MNIISDTMHIHYAVLKITNYLFVNLLVNVSGVYFTKVFRTELSHKYILVECSVIALCLPVVSKISRYKLVYYK